MRNLTFAVAALAVLAAASAARAAEWGDLTGKFVLSGDYKPGEIKPNKDEAFCGKHKIPDEWLVVGPNKGIKNIIVFLVVKEGEKSPAAHPDYDKTAKDQIKLDNEKCRFEPRVVLLRTTQTLLVSNSDTVGHNTKLDFSENTAINPLIPAGASITAKAPKMEPRAVQASCSIHGWMTSWVLVRDNPYFAVTDDEGKFTIKNIPAGKHTFQFWHESCGYVDTERKKNPVSLKVGGKALKWSKGKPEFNITAKGIDLGTIDTAATSFKKK